ncbi:MAG: hypothetical protein RQ757_11700 [Pseudomonadales bacterium]|nr:hypothetical protein [Pseudomonadales bacterium]
MTDAKPDFILTEDTRHCEINSTAAMLISVFGPPWHAEAEVASMEWFLEFEDGSHAVIRNQDAIHSSHGRIQTWIASADSVAALEKIKAKLQEGDNYYEGSLHPELFVKRED